MLDNNIPTISVIMSVYNEKVEWMHESINSILNQTFSDFEFIIINDNPTRIENSQLLEEYQKKDNRIIVLTNEQNIGLTKSLNKGIKIAKGKYIARMDADDISLPERFEKQIKVMENNPSIIVCGSKIKVFGERKNTYYMPIVEKSNDIKDLLIIRNGISHPSVLVRKDILIMNNIVYDENYIYTQDYKLWTDLYDLGDFHNIQEILLLYRTSKSHASYYALSQQNFLFISARKKYIDKILQSCNCNNIIDWNNITILTIKNIKKYNIPSRVIVILYLSLKKYTFKELFYFIFSFDFFKFSYRDNVSIVHRFLGVRK
jgi:glycosyltransferase involved in cell wall biosynthesis